jgi:tetratricopeptide (TPR) repeat protein
MRPGVTRRDLTRAAVRLVAAAAVSLVVSAQAAQPPTPPPTPPPDQSRQRDLVLQQPGPRKLPPGTVPRGYALVIGIGAYQNLDASKQLQFPETDAEAIYRVLVNHEGGSFPPENVRLLKGSQATLASIRHELEDWLPSVAQPADRVVVYFAGHGFVKDGRGYLAAWDVDPQHLETTAYPMTRLGDVLANRVKSQWKVLLTDACHSGKITAETTNDSLDQQFTSLPTNFLTLTASTEREQSYEDPKLATGFGFFTYFLEQAWTGRADNDPCDGRITADELVEYVRTNVRRYAKDRQLSQTPTARGDYEPGMILGVSTGCLDTGSSAPSMLGTAIVEVNMDEVDLYVDGKMVGKISKGKPLTIPQLSSGLHEFKGVRSGYEPERKEIMIAPGQEATVTLRIRYIRQIKKEALDFNEQGEKLFFSERSAVNPLNIVPVSRSQSTGDLRRARDLFSKALAADGNFVQAAYNLGQVNQLLSDEPASLEAYRQAITIDPAHIDARTSYAAVLIEQGDPDEAIRQLLEVARMEPSNDEVYAMLARAYWDKGAWDRCIELAEKALSLKPSNAQAHLWKADAIRQLAAAATDRERQTRLYRDARTDYREFLALTNYSTPAYEWLAFHFIGFHLGSRRHADRQPAYDALRSAGFLGLCLSEHKVGNPLRARDYCERALKHAPNDPIAYFLLGNVNRDLYNQSQACEYIKTARANYEKMIRLNPDLDEAKNARNYLVQIDGILPRLRCSGS